MGALSLRSANQSTAIRRGTLRRASNVLFVSSGSATILLDTRACRYYTLDDVGSRVWSLLHDGPSFSAIVETIRREYELPAETSPDKLEADLVDLIDGLVSNGVVHIERGSLPLVHDAPTTSLPPLYAVWAEQLLSGPLPTEAHATCHDCAMAKPPGSAATANATRFNPHAKCCTYLPILPNYLVGRILADTNASGAVGRESVRSRIAKRVGVSLLGVGVSPEYSAIYRHANPLFGKSPALICPHYIDADGGSCGIWQHRNAVCATYFCKFNRGAIGQGLWHALFELFGTIERQLAFWCARNLNVSISDVGAAWLQYNGIALPRPDEAQSGWGDWVGREEDAYVRCAELVAALSWERVLEIGGADAAASVKKVQAAYRAHADTELPEQLRLAPVARRCLDAQTSVVSGYNPNDMLVLPTRLTQALDYFDGTRSTADAKRMVADDGAREVDDALIRRLVDFGVLVRVPDLAETDLAKAFTESCNGGNPVSMLDRFRSGPRHPELDMTRLQQRVFRQAPHVVSTTLNGETVVFDVERGKYESLNQVASSVWEILAKECTFDEILNGVQEQYDLPPDVSASQMKQEIAALITRLQKARVIISDRLAAES
jgi:coenzyme PQQ synthesis protein D (PqqD)